MDTQRVARTDQQGGNKYNTVGENSQYVGFQALQDSPAIMDATATAHTNSMHNNILRNEHEPYNSYRLFNRIWFIMKIQM